MVGATVTASEHLAISLTADDYPGICYYDQINQELKYAVFGGLLWSITTIDCAGDVGRGCDVAHDSYGYAHFSYFDATHNVLKWASLI